MFTNKIVYKQKGRFGGWPANHGIWAWGDEIVVGFNSGYFKNKKTGHAIDDQKPTENLQARSLDGGKTWEIEKQTNLTLSNKEIDHLEQFKASLDFTNPNFALSCKRSGNASAKSWFYYSTDRCKNWNGPHKLPMFGQPGIAARTDYIILDDQECILFLTAAKSNGKEGRPFCAYTDDRGQSWRFRSWIGPEPEGFGIMPSSVRIDENCFLVSIRRREETRWLENYISKDKGKSWKLLNKPVYNTGGNPASMIKLNDGRICITYGYRKSPYGIRAKISNDNGQTWGEEIILRKDGGNWDLGYPRSVQREDGKIVTIYYFNEQKDQERFIASTIWEV